MSDLKIQYQGFNPSDFTKDYLDSKLNHLLARSPKGANMRAVFQRESEGITASLRIMSSAGEFFAMAKGRQLKDVNRRLMAQIKRQIMRWRTRSMDGVIRGTVVVA